MELTKEQSQLLQQQDQGPVQVRDPATNKTYVLLAAEAFEKIQPLLETPTPPAPAGEWEAVSPLPAPLPGEVPPPRQRLRDLPVPPEVAARVKKRCKELWIRWPATRRELLEEHLLQWYYGGQYVGYLTTPKGRVVVAAGRLDDAFFRQIAFLTAAERRNVTREAIRPWDDTQSIILSLDLNREG